MGLAACCITPTRTVAGSTPPRTILWHAAPFHQHFGSGLRRCCTFAFSRAVWMVYRHLPAPVTCYIPRTPPFTTLPPPLHRLLYTLDILDSTLIPTYSFLDHKLTVLQFHAARVRVWFCAAIFSTALRTTCLASPAARTSATPWDLLDPARYPPFRGSQPISPDGTLTVTAWVLWGPPAPLHVLLLPTTALFLLSLRHLLPAGFALSTWTACSAHRFPPFSTLVYCSTALHHLRTCLYRVRVPAAIWFSRRTLAHLLPADLTGFSIFYAPKHTAFFTGFCTPLDLVCATCHRAPLTTGATTTTSPVCDTISLRCLRFSFARGFPALSHTFTPRFSLPPLSSYHRSAAALLHGTTSALYYPGSRLPFTGFLACRFNPAVTNTYILVLPRAIVLLAYSPVGHSTVLRCPAMLGLYTAFAATAHCLG